MHVNILQCHKYKLNYITYTKFLCRLLVLYLQRLINNTKRCISQIQRIALQRNENMRLQFQAEISAFNPNQLVFVDETGIVSIKQHICCHFIHIQTEVVTNSMSFYFYYCRTSE